MTKRPQPPWHCWQFDPRVRYSDLTASVWAAKRPKPYEPVFLSMRPAYFPWLLAILRRAGTRPVWDMRVMYAMLVACVTMFWGWPALLVSVVSYPAIFSDDRGNLDHVINAGALVAVGLLYAGFPVLGGVLLGMAAATKGYPMAWGLLWWGSWLGLGAVVGTCLACTVGPMLCWGLRETWTNWRQGLKDFSAMTGPCVLGPDYSNAHYCSDPLNAVRLLHWWRGKAFPYQAWARVNLVVVTGWALGLTWLAWTTPHLWVCCLALGLIQCVWPGVCTDYKLTVLGLGFALALSAAAPWGVLACLGVLWLPKHCYFPRYPMSKGSISCLINPVALVVLTVLLWLV